MKLTNAGPIVSRIIENVNKKSNNMLNISPESDCTIPGEQQKILSEIGSWSAINGAGIYCTRAWTFKFMDPDLKNLLQGSRQNELL